MLLRKELDLYACVRPCKALEGVRTRFPETDLVIIRENTEDLYAGIEFERGTPENAALREKLAELGSIVRDDAGISIKPISVFGSERIVRHAFDYAVTHGYKKVVAAHKANIMKFSDGLFLEVAREVAADYPAIEFAGLHHRQPLQPADHVSGGLRGHRPAQPLRGHRVGPVRRDDRRAGRGGRREHRHAGRRVRGDARLVADVRGLQPDEPDGDHAVGRLHARPPRRSTPRRARWRTRSPPSYAKGDKVTYDLKPSRTDPTAVGTSEFADAVIEEMNA